MLVCIVFKSWRNELNYLKLRKIFAVSTILLLVNTSPASALFGSECKKPKLSASALGKSIISLSNSLKTAEAEQSKSRKIVVLTEAMRKERYKACMKPTNGIKLGEAICKGMLAPYPKTIDECAVAANICNDLARRIYTLTLQIEKLKNDQAQVIINNQKCFDPLIVVRAQDEAKY